MHVTMIVKSDVCNDARVVREATALTSTGHRVTVIGEQRPETGAPPPGVEVRWTVESPGPGTGAAVRRRAPAWVRWLGLPTHRRRAIRRFDKRATAMALAPSDAAPEVVHAHDLSALGAASKVAAATGARLVYDAHECWTGRRLEGRPEPIGRWLDSRRERSLGSRADRVLTVSPAIASWFQQRYGWHDVAVVRNTFPLHPAPDQLPPLASPPTDVVYAGRIDGKRDLGTAAAALADHPLGLRIVGAGEEDLRVELVGAGVDVAPLMPLDEVDAVYRRAGLALVSLTDDQRNHELALPNKVFHAVRAGVPVVAADLPELGRLVRTHDLGELYSPGDPGSLRAAVDRVVARHGDLLAAVDRAAGELTWPRDEAILLDVYEDLEARR